MDNREQTGESGPNEKEAAKRSPMVDGEDHHVDPRSVHAIRIIAIPVILAATVIPLGFITLGWALDGIPTRVYLPLLGTLLLIVSLVLIIAYRFTSARYHHLRYRADPDGLRIQRGVFWRKKVWIPITRVQHTDVSQGPLQRKYELATLTVHTAGTVGASIPLPGLEHSIALRLSDHLQPNREHDAG